MNTKPVPYHLLKFDKKSPEKMWHENRLQYATYRLLVDLMKLTPKNKLDKLWLKYNWKLGYRKKYVELAIGMVNKRFPKQLRTLEEFKKFRGIK